MVSRPSHRLSQNASTSLEPGKRPAIAMIATGSSSPPERRGAVILPAEMSGCVDEVLASAAGDGWANSAVMATSRPDSRFTCSTTRTASSEPPPSSKKLSLRPIRSRSSTAAMAPHRAVSSSPCGGSNGPAQSGRCRPGTGSAARSSLPLGVSGIASSATYATGTM